MRFIQPKALLVALGAIAIIAVSCKKDEPAPRVPDRLEGSWNIDSVTMSFQGFPFTVVPTSSDLTLREDGTGNIRYAATIATFPVGDTANVLKWSKESNSITLVTSNSSGTDTTTYVRQLDEQNSQRWYTSATATTVRLTRK